MSSISAPDMSAACPLQLEHRHELLAHSLELLFRSLLVGNVQRVCLAHASIHGALSRYSDGFERVLSLCEVSCTSPRKKSCDIGP